MNGEPLDDKIKILLVDDRQENLISLAAILDSQDYELVMAQSGAEALKWILHEDFALILLDVQMPGMDGFETATLIKQRSRSKHIPIIFITAISMDQPFVFKGYDAGAVDYIAKPFEPNILRSKVAIFAELHRKNRQLLLQAERLRQTERLEREREIARMEMEILRRERAANERYKALVDGIDNGIVWAADPQSLNVSFVSARAENILGYPIEKWIDEQSFLMTCVHEEDREAVREALIEGLQQVPVITLEHRFYRADGEEVWFQTGVRLTDRIDGMGQEIRGLSVDISSLKHAQQEAQKAIRVRDEFLSIASHELNTPLTPLKLQLQGLKRLTSREGVSVDELLGKLNKVIGVTDRQVDRLAKLVSELLDVSRINNGKLVIEKEEFDLSEMVQDVCTRFSDELQRTGCEVQLDLDEGSVGVWDRMRIEQVVINLLTNAMRYGEGKPIHVRVSHDDEEVRIDVEDFGMGIKPEDQTRIFSQFERAVSTANFGGLGLGLYIVSQILEAHHGRISLQSEPGKGSTFTVRLPRGIGPGLQTSKHQVAAPQAVDALR